MSSSASHRGQPSVSRSSTNAYERDNRHPGLAHSAHSASQAQAPPPPYQPHQHHGPSQSQPRPHAHPTGALHTLRTALCSLLRRLGGPPRSPLARVVGTDSARRRRREHSRYWSRNAVAGSSVGRTSVDGMDSVDSLAYAGSEDSFEAESMDEDNMAWGRPTKLPKPTPTKSSRSTKSDKSATRAKRTTDEKRGPAAPAALSTNEKNWNENENENEKHENEAAAAAAASPTSPVAPCRLWC